MHANSFLRPTTSRPPVARSVAVKSSGSPSAALQAAKAKFNDGTDTVVPPILNGLWTLAGGHGQAVYDRIDEALESAANNGYYAFDTADIYGPSEGILGQFVAKRKAEGKPVQAYTKFVPNVFQTKATPAVVEASIRRSLRALQTDSLDLVQMHWWDYSIPGMVDAALALTDLKAKGLIKSVGMTNMDTEALDKMWAAGVPIANNQVQFSLLDRRPLNGMVEWCKQRDVRLFTYGSVGGGLLSDKYHDPAPKSGPFGIGKSYKPVDLNTSSLKMYYNIIRAGAGQNAPQWHRDLLAALRAVADRHEGSSIATVALAWVIGKGEGVVHPIVGLRSSDHLAENTRAVQLAKDLSAQDLKEIDEVLAKNPGPRGDCYSIERSRHKMEEPDTEKGCFRFLFRRKVHPQGNVEEKGNQRSHSAKTASKDKKKKANDGSSGPGSMPAPTNTLSANEGYDEMVNMLVSSYHAPLGVNQGKEPGSRTIADVAHQSTGPSFHNADPSNRSSRGLAKNDPSGRASAAASHQSQYQSGGASQLNMSKRSSALGRSQTRDRRGSFLVSDAVKPQSVRASVFDAQAMVATLQDAASSSGVHGSKKGAGGSAQPPGVAQRALGLGPQQQAKGAQPRGPRKLDM